MAVISVFVYSTLNANGTLDKLILLTLRLVVKELAETLAETLPATLPLKVAIPFVTVIILEPVELW